MSYFGEMFVSELLVLYIIIIWVVVLHGYPQKDATFVRNLFSPFSCIHDSL